MQSITLGTRGSELALRQTEMVTAELLAAFPDLTVSREIIQTIGDQRTDLRFVEFHGGAVPQADKGIFIKELENALDDGRVHAAVHSLKDMPSALEDRFCIAAVLPRAPVEDVLITRLPASLETLPPGARVGTSSVRRARQIHWLRPDLEIVEIRGNVPTRVRKLLGDQPLDAVMLAAAGLQRLGLLASDGGSVQIDGTTLPTVVLNPAHFLPAAGQGAVAIECLAARADVRSLLAKLNDAATAARIAAEREFLRLLGAGCQTPVGAHTWLSGDTLHMQVRVFNEQDPTAPPVEHHASAPSSEPLRLASDLVARL